MSVNSGDEVQNEYTKRIIVTIKHNNATVLARQTLRSSAR